jgi:hypothetical protein
MGLLMARIRNGQREYNAEYYRLNRDRIRAQQSGYATANSRAIVASRKGLTLSRIESMLAEQGGLCAICEVPMASPHIDHDHKCCPGTRSCGLCVRGLLCAACNHMIGKAHDTPSVLTAGAQYLRRYEGRR